MTITKLMTNKGEFDTNDSLEELLKNVEVSKKDGSLLELNRGELDSNYQGQPCKDTQKVYLDLSVVEIHGYSTHDLAFKEE